jgi:hypothetical protein
METTKSYPCYKHQGNFDCTPFCPNCEGNQEITMPFKACEVEGCDYNMYGMSPSHAIKERCRSAKKPHCTCDICF